MDLYRFAEALTPDEKEALLTILQTPEMRDPTSEELHVWILGDRFAAVRQYCTRTGMAYDVAIKAWERRMLSGG
jgi:hypothetical protein